MSKESSEPASGQAIKKSILDFGSPARVILSTLVIFLASQLAAGLVVQFWYSLSGTTQLFSHSPFGQFAFIVLAETLVVLGILLVLRLRNLKIKYIGWGRPLRRSDISSALAGFAVFFGLQILIMGILQLIITDLDVNETQDVGFTNLTGSFDWVLAFISLVILAPLGEEFLMRGYLFSGLRTRLRFAPTAIVTSLLFGIAHIGGGDSESLLWSAGVVTFVLGLVLAYLREKTGAIYAGLLVHIFNNLAAFIIYFSQ